MARLNQERAKISMGLISGDGSDDSDGSGGEKLLPPRVPRYGAAGEGSVKKLNKRKVSFSDAYIQLDKAYEDKIAHESEKVENFYKEQMGLFKERFENLRPHTAEEDAFEKGVHAQYSLKRAFIDLYRQMNFLTNYSILNYTAFVKICKKHDKVVGIRTKSVF